MTTMDKKLHSDLKNRTITRTLADDLRDRNAQQQFRRKFTPEELKGKQASHIFPLCIAAYFNQKKFIDPPVRKKKLKKTCNLQINFELALTVDNLEVHNKTDIMLRKKFKDEILPQIETNREYNSLLTINPSKLANIITNNGFSRVTLTGLDVQRAKDQASMVQKLPFPLKYMAFARLFYCCFQDEKQAKLWNDKKNSSEFNKFLETNCKINNDDQIYDDEKHDDEDTINNESDSKSSDSESNEPSEDDDEKHDEKLSNSITTSKKQFVDDDDDPCVGIDDKGRILYEGPNGGIYYKTKGGNKVYMNELDTYKWEKLQYTKDGEIDKRCKAYKLMSETGNVESITDNDECFGEDEKGRALYIGSKGSIYYLTNSGNRVYIKRKDVNYENDDDEKADVMDDVETVGLTKSSGDKCIGIDNNGHILYEGRKKGMYYKTQTGNKVYVKVGKEEIDKLQYNTKGQIDKRCKAYKLMVANGIVFDKFGQVDIMTEMNMLKSSENMSKEEDISVGKDDKGRALYKGSKGGVYYKTKTGNKVYIQK